MSKKALCIGINNYPGTANDLSGCVNDAHDWAALLSKKGFTVNTLLDAAATKAAMVSAIDAMIEGAAKGDSLIITYSGHGTWVPDSSGDEPDGRDEALCPHDLTSKGALLDDEIHALFAKRGAGVRIVLISDSCHSGSVSRGSEEDVDPGVPRIRFMPPEVWMSKKDRPPAALRSATTRSGFSRSGGDLLLAGCLDTEYSYDTSFNGRANGAFTYYALKALADIKPTASYEKWFKAIRTYLPSTRLPQTPQIFGTKTARTFKIFQ